MNRYKKDPEDDGSEIAEPQVAYDGGYCATPLDAPDRKIGFSQTSVGHQRAPSFEGVLRRLTEVTEETRAAFPDPAHREIVWRDLQRLAAGPLWTSVERPEHGRYRRQLADVLDAAVAKLEAFQLTERHFSVIEATLARLAAATVTETDVDRCESEWRAAGVDTLPSMKEAFEEWLASSASGIDDAD